MLLYPRGDAARKRVATAYAILATNDRLPLTRELRALYQRIGRMTLDSAAS